MPRHDWRRPALALCLLAAFGLASPARAAAPVHAFNIPRKPLSAALVDLALQAGVSISTRAAETCAPSSQPLIGRYSLGQALDRLLAGTGCGYRLVDARAVEIVRLPPPRPAATPLRVAPLADVAELVVVATRQPTPADRLAYPVSALEGRTLESQGVRDASDLALVTPAMTVTNLGSGRDKILLRGLSDGPLTGRTQSMVGLYLDDARITYNAPDPDLRLTDVAQVEVLRGPQGALYGSGSLGGVLHLVTAAPDASRSTGWLSVSGGVTHGGSGSNLLEGMVNLPILKDRAAMRMVAYREVQGGYIDDVGLGLKDVNRSIRTGGRLALSLRLNADWTANGGLVFQAINSDDTQYALAGEAPFTRRNALREPHDNDFAMVHLGLTGDLGWAEARWTTAYVRHQLTSRYDATRAPPVAVPSGPAAFDDENNIASLVTEATLSSHPDARVQWLGGLFVARTRQDVTLDLTALGATPFVALSEARRDRLDEAALYGQMIWPLTDRLSLTLGGRLFSSRTQVDSVISTPATVAAAYAAGLSRTGFSPKLLISYAPTARSLIYVEAAEGYRAGGINTTGAPGQAFSAPGGPEPYRNYQGDELWSFEAGGRVTLLEGRLSLRGAIFQASWKNIQSDQLLASALPFTANIGDGRNRGLEAEAAYRAGPLVLRAEGLVNAPELDRANPAFPARAELGLAGAPNVSLGVSAHYGWELPRDRTFELDGRYAYVGPSHLTFDAVTSPRMGGYGAGRLAATLAADRWRLTLAVDNPTESRGDTFAYGNPFTLRTTTQVTPLRPRTLSLCLKVAY
ncbi:TonB-dependent receptor domain-containing protein [Phenylobacterium aquaticum]|uniref:TonB-dependent receptor domain-containing protein n=1 Tax=Phenylobacterium aquaticum TaxID=1763816 RepID=UPI0026EF349C|nr:TonB-dependent receptor [Phenylobacterium aquaticum]